MSVVNRVDDTRNGYLELIRQFPLRPLRCDDDLDAAARMVDRLLDRGPTDQAEADYLEVLSDLIERYEAAEHPIKPLPDAEMLRHLIDAKGVRQTQVAKGTGIPDSTISEVLSGKRGLNRAHIGKLASYFHVSPEVFTF
jgi:HTH-type transcriptional regulator/antitoxin HigA